MNHLGSTLARVKLKGIDGGPHKQWSMWFNSTQREEPYLGLTCSLKQGKLCTRKGGCTGDAWQSIERAVKGLVKSMKERDPWD